MRCGKRNRSSPRKQLRNRNFSGGGGEIDAGRLLEERECIPLPGCHGQVREKEIGRRMGAGVRCTLSQLAFRHRRAIFAYCIIR